MYGYDELTNDVSQTATVVGKSALGRNIYAVREGKGGILIHGAIHAREHITAYITAQMALYNARYRLLRNVCFVPMVNPDGVELCIKGINSVPLRYRTELLKINGYSYDFSLWKANARGVDLNLNFNADWGKGKGNLTYPAPHGYIGKYPESEPESRALIGLLNDRFSLALSFHAKGEELYYGYGNYDPCPTLTAKISDVLGYPAKKTIGSTGGFKDRCVLVDKIPSYTVEFGDDSKMYSELYEDKDRLVELSVKLMELLARYDR